MKKGVFLIFLVIFIFSINCVSAQLAETSWPMFHGGPQHGGLSEVNTSHLDGSVKWLFETDESVESSPVIGPDGTIYVGSHENKLYAINPDGTEKWNFYVGEPEHHEEFDVYKGILSTPAVDKDGTIYFSSLSDYFFALNPDGSEKWRIRMPFTADVWSSPAIDTDGTIYIGSSRRFDENLELQDTSVRGKLYAINPDGSEKWSYDIGSDVCPSPAIGKDGTIYIAGYEGAPGTGKLCAVNRDGSEKWCFPIDKWIESSPTVGSDGTIYMGSWIGVIYALNPDGSLKWEYKTDEGVSSVPAIGKDGTIYVGSWDRYFYAFNPDGTVKWKYQTGEAFEAITAGAAIGADGTIYVPANEGKFYAFNPNGTVKWTFKIDMGSSSPAIDKDGTIYVGAGRSVIAFGSPDEALEIQPFQQRGNFSNETYYVNLSPNETYYEGYHEEPGEENFFNSLVNFFINLLIIS